MTLAPQDLFRLNQFIGWELTRIGEPGKEGLCIGRIPGRTRFALYRDAPGSCRPLAYFAKYEDAVEAARLIGALVSGRYSGGAR